MVYPSLGNMASNAAFVHGLFRRSISFSLDNALDRLGVNMGVCPPNMGVAPPKFRSGVAAPAVLPIVWEEGAGVESHRERFRPPLSSATPPPDDTRGVAPYCVVTVCPDAITGVSSHFC